MGEVCRATDSRLNRDVAVTVSSVAFGDRFQREARAIGAGELFNQRYQFGLGQTTANYDVSPDGQSFVMVKDQSSSSRLNVVLNWFEHLRRLAPVER